MQIKGEIDMSNTYFLIMKKDDFRKILEGEFEIKTSIKIPTGENKIKYRYKTDSSGVNRNYSNNLLYSIHSLLETDIYCISSTRNKPTLKYSTKSKNYYNNMDMNNLDLSRTALYHVDVTDMNNYNKSNVDIIELKETESYDDILKAMDIYDPHSTMPICYFSCIEFILSTLLDKDKFIKRSIEDLSYSCDISRYVQSELKIKHMPAKIYLNNMKYFKCTNLKLLLAELLVEESKDVQIIEDIIVNFASGLLDQNILNQNMYYITHLIEASIAKKIFTDESLFNLAKRLTDQLITINASYKIFAFMSRELIDTHVDYFFEAFRNNLKYNTDIVDYFKKHKDEIDVNLINGNKCRAISILDYNDLVGINTDPHVLRMAEYIRESGTIIGERIIALICFMNMYKLEDLKSMNIDSISDAVLGKLLSKFSYSIAYVDVIGFTENTENVQYLCDKVLTRLIETKLPVASRIKVIEENKDKTNGRDTITNLYSLLHNSVIASEDAKVMKAMVNYSI